MRGEVREPDLDGHGLADLAGRPEPGGGALGQPQQLAPDHLRVVDVVRERLLVADAALALRRHDAARVAPPGQLEQLGARRPGPARGAGCRPGCARCRRRCAARSGAASPRSSPPRPTARRPAAGAAPAGSAPRARRTARPAWPAPRPAWRRTSSRPRPTEHATPCSSCTRSRMCWAISRGPAEPADRPGDVQERLVQGQRLDQRGDVGEHGHHARRETVAYRLWSGSITTARGHSRRARDIGIAACTPKVRAS